MNVSMFLKLAVCCSLVLALLMVLVVITQTFVLLVSLGLSGLIAGYLLIALRGHQKKNVRKGNSKLMPTVRVPFFLFYFFMIIPIAFASYYTFQQFNIEAVYSTVIAFAMTMTFLYSFVNVPLAVYHKDLENRKRMNSSFFPLVTIIIPAFNEESTISKSIASAIETNYPRKQILVVNDGSTDNTFGIAKTYSKKLVSHTALTGQSIDLSVLDKANGGKASAINYALRFAKGDFIIIVDADSIVGREAIIETIKNFQDPSVAAVAGNIKVLNRRNVITYCQALEYLIGINLFKRAFDVFGVVMVVPGALGGFRKTVLSSSGDFDNNTLTEDFDATVKVLKTGKSVQGSTFAMSFTEAPSNLGELYKQRLRWNRGNMQTLLKHKDIISTSRYGMLHKFGYPLIFLTMVTQPILGFIVTSFVVLALIQGMWFFVLVSFLVFVTLEWLLSMIAITIDNDDWKVSLVSPLFVVGYKQINDFFIVKSILDVLVLKRGRKFDWTTAKEIKQGDLHINRV